MGYTMGNTMGYPMGYLMEHPMRFSRAEPSRAETLFGKLLQDTGGVDVCRSLSTYIRSMHVVQVR